MTIPMIQFDQVTVRYQQPCRLERHLAVGSGQHDFGRHRTGQFGQDDILEVHQSHDRLCRRRSRRRPGGRQWSGCAHDSQRLRTPSPRRHGLSVAGRPCRCRSTTTWRMPRVGPDSMTARNSMRWSKNVSVRPSYGTKSRTACTRWEPKLSGGQQQRLTLARALSHRPEILCLDEFSIAIDPVTTMKIEDVLLELKNEMTIVLVTNLVQQAHRLGRPYRVL